MRKIILFSFSIILFFSANSHAFAVAAALENATYNKFFEDLNEEMSALVNRSYIFNGVEMAAGCSAFISREARLGDLGMYTMQELTSGNSDYSRLIHSNAMQAYCPKYNSLDLRSKSLIWTLLLMSMAQFESTCDGSATNQGPNGIARGLFQLHQGQETVYDGDDDSCVKNASYDDRKSIKCALGMLNGQLVRSGNQIFYSRSYWDVLRPNGEAQTTEAIASALRKARVCN